MPGPGWKKDKGYVGGKPGRSMGSGASKSGAKSKGLTYLPPPSSSSSSSASGSTVAAGYGVGGSKPKASKPPPKREGLKATHSFSASKLPKPPDAGSTEFDALHSGINRGYREAAAQTRKREGMEQLIAKHYETDEKGRVVKKEQRVPVPKEGVSSDKIDRSMKKLDQKLKEIKPSSHLREAANAATMRKLYKTDKSGRLVTETRKLPVLKTSPEALQKDLATLRESVKRTRKAPGRPDEFKENAPVQQELKPAFPGTVDATKEEYSEDLADAIVRDTQKQGLVPIDPNFVGTAQGLVHGGLAQFTRPVRAVQAATGKAAVEAGLIKGDTAKKIRKAPGPLGAFLANMNNRDVVIGSDITQGLFNAPQAGLAADIVMDPLLFVGTGALPKAAPKRVGALESRLAREAPDVLKATRYKRIRAEAGRTGELGALEGYLRRAAAARGVTKLPRSPKQAFKRLGDRRKGKRRALAGIQEQNNRLLDKVRATIDAAPRIRSEKVVLPGSLAKDVVAQVAASQARTRQIRPGFQLRLTSPTGGKTYAALPIPLPKSLLLPTAISRGGKHGNAIRAAAHARRTGRATGEVAEDLHKQIDELDAQLLAAKASGDQNAQLKIENSIVDRMSELGAARVAAATESERLGTLGALERLDEFTERVNRRRKIREPFRQTSNMARMLEQDMQKHISRAVRDIETDPTALLRVSLYRNMRQDVGDAKMFSELGRLSDKERHAIEMLDALDEAMGRHGIQAGTVNALVENYATRIPQRTGRPLGTRADDPLESMANSLGAGPIGRTFAQRHRQQPELSSLADPEVLSRAIQQASRGRITARKAGDMAEQWHRMGNVRSNIEIMARALQRGREIHVNDLTPMERRALNWSQYVGDKDAPLFAIDEDGFLHLDAQAHKAHGFAGPDEVFEGLTDLERQTAGLHSAMLDRARAEEAMRYVTKNSAIYKQWESVKRRLDDEVSELDLKGKDFGVDPEARATAKAASEGRRASQKRALQIRTKVRELESELRGSPTAARRAKIENELSTLRRRLAAQEGAITRGKLREAGANELMESSAPISAAERSRFETYGFEFGSDTPISKIVGPQYRELVRRGGESFKDQPLPAMKPHTANEGRRDPFDYTGRLDDLRKPGDKLFFEMDPRIAQTHRVRVEALKTAFNARWRGLDEAIGVSKADAVGETATLPDGTTVHVSQLKRQFDEEAPGNGQVGWIHRETGETYLLNEVDLGDKMLPVVFRPGSREGHIFWDPKSGQEFMRPAEIDDVLGREIQEIIGEDQLWPTAVFQDVKGELLRMGDTGYEAIFDTGMHAAWQRTMSLIRYSVTTPFPAYHVRNMVSDALKSLQADSGVAFHPISSARLGALAVRRNGKRTIKVPGFGRELAPEEFLLIADLFSIRSSQHLAEYLALARTGKIPGRWQRRLSPGPKGKIGKGLIEIGARREDITRFITFMQRMRRNKGDVADAAWHMIHHHFDYGDLTAFERKKVRNVFLFYTWYRKNIPLQFAQMIQRPGFFSAVANTYIEFGEGGTPFNMDWSKINPLLPDMSGPVAMRGSIPDYMTQTLGAVVTNWNGHATAFGFGAPWTDINMVMNAPMDPAGSGRQVASLFNPGITMFIQGVFRKELLTGRDWKDFEPTAPQIAKALDAIGVEVQKTEDGRLAIPWGLNIAIRNLPFAGRASSYFLEPSGEIDTGRLQKNRLALSGLLGINAVISPGLDRREEVKREMFRGKLGELTGKSFDFSNLKNSKKLRKEWIKNELKPWTEENHIPKRVLETEKGSPWYKPKEDPGTISGFSTSGGTISRRKNIPGLGGSQSDRHPAFPGFKLDDQSLDLDSLRPFGGLSFKGVTRKMPKFEEGELRALINGVAGGLTKAIFSEDQRQKQKHANLTKLAHQNRKPADEEARTRRDARKKLQRKFPELGGASRFIADASKKYGVDPEVLSAIYGIETAFGTNTNDSSAGAQGPMQFMPETFASYGVRAYNRKGAPNVQDTADAIFSAANYLSASGYARDPRQAIFAYNHADWYVNDVVENSKGFESKLWRAAAGTKAPKKFKKQPGNWAGSGHVGRKVIGKQLMSGASSIKEERDNVPGSSGTSWHDVDTKDAWAADLPATGPAGEQLAKQLAKRAGIKGYHTGDYTEWTSPKHPGYTFQILWAVDGHYDHVHFGTRWAGDSLPLGTRLGGPASGVAAPGGSGGGTSSYTTPGAGPPGDGRSELLTRLLRKSEKRLRTPVDVVGNYQLRSQEQVAESPETDSALPTGISDRADIPSLIAEVRRQRAAEEEPSFV